MGECGCRISSFMDQVDVGDSVISGDLCLYSCKYEIQLVADWCWCC